MKVKVKIIKSYDPKSPEEWALYDDKQECAFYFKNKGCDEIDIDRKIMYQSPGIRRVENLKDGDEYEIVYDTKTFRPKTARHLKDKNGNRVWEKDLFFKDFIEFWDHKRSLNDIDQTYSYDFHRNREEAQKKIFEQNGFKCCPNIEYGGFLGCDTTIKDASNGYGVKEHGNEKFCSFCGLLIEKMTPFITPQHGDHYRDYLYNMSDGQVVWLAISGLLDRNLKRENMNELYEHIIQKHNLNIKDLIKKIEADSTRIYQYYPQSSDKCPRFIFKAEAI